MEYVGTLSGGDMRAVNTVCEIVRAELSDCPQIAELARRTGTSASKLQSDFKTAVGMTIHDYVCEERMRRARELLNNSDEPVYRVAIAVGCKKPGHFARLFKERYGQTPTEHRKSVSEKLSAKLEGYLDAVYELSAENGARLTDLAARMNVTKPTASAAVAALAKKGLLKNGHYQHIVLTEAGTAMAKSITGKHAVLRRFWREMLGVDELTADADACAIEHVISDSAVEAMRRTLREQENKT